MSSLRTWKRHTTNCLSTFANTSIILRNGGNDYKLPHVGKLKVARLIGRDFPTMLPCQAIISNEDITEAAIAAFVTTEDTDGTFVCLLIVVSPFTTPPLIYLIVAF